MRNIEIPHDVFNAVIQTLSALPWAQVAPLMQKLQETAKQVEQPETPPSDL